ncbi:methionine synthase [Streptacidiphilus monticola]|uniref:Methionine synthase n=1 Tax=Streptacidiphilus monticola TaxID=2161674 RepID=A0ABW1FYP3_9ACTN
MLQDVTTFSQFPQPEGPPASGVGSMPGTDVREAVKTALGAMEGSLGFLPELPARGPGADMIGRGMGLLVELFARVEPSGWRIGDHPGRDTRRAHAYLREDLDTLEEFAQEWTGPLKVQAVGPWTLAASVELPRGEKALADPGAVRDFSASLAEGLRLHLADVRKRVPGASGIVVQLDEPSLPAVLAGQVRTASGWQRLRAVDPGVARENLAAVIGAVDAPVVVHCCAPDVPIDLLRRAGAAAVSLDFSLLTERSDDAVGEGVESGLVLFAGVVPPLEPGLSDPAGSVTGVRTLWRRLGLDPALLARHVVVTPSCGLAGASPAYARRALLHSVTAAKSLSDNPE